MNMHTKEKKIPSPVDLDTILIEEIGQVGRYQFLVFFLATIPVIFGAFGAGEYVFTTARINTRCLIPECDAAVPQYTPSWLLNAVPGATLTDFDNCNRYVNISASVTPPIGNTCPASLFNRQQITSCESYVHENTNTVVYDFGLECEEWRRTYIGSIRMFGTLLALPITGFISDRWGRKVALAFNAFNTAWIGLLRIFLVSYEWFIALETLEATFGSGAFSTCYVLVTELVGPKYRVMAGASLESFFALGQVILGLLAWTFQDWRTLTMVLYVPQLLTIIYFWIMAESVRWLMSKGRYAEADKILKRAAKINKKHLSEKSLEGLKVSVAQEEANKSIASQNEPLLIVQVFKSKTILLRCCITPFWWVTTLVVYYGLSVNSVSLAGNRFLNYAYVSAIEIPGYWTAILVLDRIGRKPTLIIGYIVCAACQFAIVFMPQNYPTLSLLLFLVGKYSISVVMASMYIYTAELYPTKYRHSLFAFSSMVGRIGSITAPLTPALMVYWPGIPFVIFGSMALMSAALVLTTPETNNTNLPDSMEDAENIGKKIPA